MAMVGKECVAIAADTRLGAQAQTISCDFDKVFQMGPKLFCGLPGLATDVLTVYEKTPAPIPPGPVHPRLPRRHTVLF